MLRTLFFIYRKRKFHTPNQLFSDVLSFKKYIPILEWLPNYNRKDLAPDILAGLTNGVVVIPSGMAYGMLAGLPPIYGLYTALIPMFFYGLFGTSKHMIIGPAAIIALLVTSGLTPLAEPKSAEYIGLVITLTFIVGILQLAMGLFRLGVIVKLLSHPVISGFTSAASIIVFFSQLKYLLGIDITRTNFVHQIIMEAVDKFELIHLPTVAIGVSGIAIMVIAKSIHKLLPGPLFAVIAGILVVYFLDLDQSGVAIVGHMKSGIPVFTLPVLETKTLIKMIPVILTITIIGVVESLVIAKAVRTIHKNSYEIDPDQEIRALGVSNTFASFFQAFPAAGSFSRTAVNDTAGGKTGLASMIGAFSVILALLFLTSYFFYLPNAILASIIMVAIVKFIDYKDAINLFKKNKLDFLTFLVTFVSILLIGIEPGLGIGVAFSLGVAGWKKYWVK